MVNKALTRRFYRIDTNIQAKLRATDKKEWDVTIRNLSYGGFLINAPEDVPQGTLLKMNFILPGFLIPFEVPVQVANIQDPSKETKRPRKKLGLKVMEYSETWYKKIPVWIDDQIHARSMRKRTSLLLTLTGLGFTLKATLAACGIQLFQGVTQRAEFWGALRWAAQILSNPHLNLLLACLCCYAGWTILRPNPNRRLLNWLFAVTVAGALVFRVFVKAQLLLGGKSQQLIFALDYLMAVAACASLIFMLQAENFFRQYDSLRDRELVGPKTFSKEAV